MYQTISAKWRRLFKTVYPWANSALEIWLLICNVAYLFDKTPFYRPWLRWVGADIRRLGAEDMVRLFIIFVSLAKASNSPRSLRQDKLPR